jgi:hypothetical protein
MASSYRFTARAFVKLALCLLPLAFVGCVTAPPTARIAPGATPLAPTTRIAVLPLDVEVAELTAGGIVEKRDDWTAQVVANLNASLSKNVRCHLGR